ncbi:hypothetical protein RIR_jg16035.t1 [Rhizophagus irregularis DAOM 181602=DAOM 197198]|nr:hypothetical protein RIR_jg16035.t1 [Rhizophagus irregularis DAOM 181602=DAOM 197198]
MRRFKIISTDFDKSDALQLSSEANRRLKHKGSLIAKIKRSNYGTIFFWTIANIGSEMGNLIILAEIYD